MQEVIRADKALENDPHVRRQPALWEKVSVEVRAYGLRLADAGKALGNGRSPEQDRASREAGAQMAARRRADILDIVRRFSVAHGS